MIMVLMVNGEDLLKLYQKNCSCKKKKRQLHVYDVNTYNLCVLRVSSEIKSLRLHIQFITKVSSCETAEKQRQILMK
jgi:hypothetical protein